MSVGSEQWEGRFDKMYFALFILEQLKEEVDTMMSGGAGTELGGGAVFTQKQEPKRTRDDARNS